MALTRRGQDEALLQAVRRYGTNWATIAFKHLPNRTALALRNRYNTLRPKTSPAHLDAAGTKRTGSVLAEDDGDEDEDDEEDDGDSSSDDGKDDNEPSMECRRMPPNPPSPFAPLDAPPQSPFYRPDNAQQHSSLARSLPFDPALSSTDGASQVMPFSEHSHLGPYPTAPGSLTPLIQGFQAMGSLMDGKILDSMLQTPADMRIEQCHLPSPPQTGYQRVSPAHVMTADPNQTHRRQGWGKQGHPAAAMGRWQTGACSRRRSRILGTVPLRTRRILHRRSGHCSVRRFLCNVRRNSCP